MENKLGRKGQRSTPRNTLNNKKQRKQISQSANKAMSTLSMSFYDDSTLKKRKQIILDSCPAQTNIHFQPKKDKNSSKMVNKRSVKKVKAEPKYELPLGKQRDEIDFTTTEASKLNTFEERQRRPWVGDKMKTRNSLSQQKKSSQKYKKQMFLDMLQNRSKTSKGVFEHNQFFIIKRF